MKKMHPFWATICQLIILLTPACKKSSNDSNALTGYTYEIPVDTVNAIKLIYGGNLFDFFHGLDQIGFMDWKGTDTTGSTYHHGNNMGIGVPPNVRWPSNITFLGSLLLKTDSIKQKTDSYVIYALDSSLWNKVTFVVLNPFVSFDTSEKYVVRPGGLAYVFAKDADRPTDSTLTANYNAYVLGLNNWYNRYWRK